MGWGKRVHLFTGYESLTLGKEEWLQSVRSLLKNLRIMSHHFTEAREK